ncbi:MAG: LptF/LptG family permease [Cyanobacteria bacterium J06623_7]
MSKKYASISLLDRYLITRLMPNLILAISICTILSELIGISFEQVKFVALEGLPLKITALVHLLKLPAFFTLSLPLSILMATIITYSQLAKDNEIVAFQSQGISLFRLFWSPVAIALCLAMVMFLVGEFVVPQANYQTAIILETEWGVDRTQLAKYNKQEIIYQQFSGDRAEGTLEYLFFAERFDGKRMHGITLLDYQHQQLDKIITAKIGQWQQSQQHWQLLDGTQIIVSGKRRATTRQDFSHLALPLTKDILDYANHHRDNREMSILALYRRLEIISNTNHQNNIRQLQISIQERYALPASCIAFALLGTTLGIVTAKKVKSAALTISAIAIFLYFATQFMATSLTASGILPVFLGVWLPNILSLLLVFYGAKTQRI